MASAIDATKPTDSVGYTGDLRANLAAAKSEIEALQTIVASRIGSLHDDKSPDLDGNLNTNGFLITTLVTNGNVTLTPNGAGALLFNGDEIQVGKNIRHIGDTDTKIEFGDAGDTVLIVTGGAERVSTTNAGTRLGGSGARITSFSNDATAASKSATLGITEQAAKGYTDANKGIASLSADPSPALSGSLNGGGHPIVNYTQPRVNSVSGTLTQEAHGGRPCHVTGTVGVPNTDGFVCELRNKSGSAKTVNFFNQTGVTGNFIHEGVTKTTFSLPNQRSVVVAGDGADIWVYGALA